MTAFLAGQVLTAAELSSWTQPLDVLKPSATARTSTTTFADDPHLTLTVPANQTYEGQLIVLFASGTTGDIKIQLTWAGTASVTYSIMGPGTGIASTSAGADVATGPTARLDTTSPGATLVAGGTTAGHLLIVPMRVSTTATTTMTVQWAQNASDATATSILEGSWWTMRRVA